MKNYFISILLIVVIFLTFILGVFWGENRLQLSLLRSDVKEVVFRDIGKHFMLYKLHSEGNYSKFQSILLTLIDLDLNTLVDTIKFEPDAKDSILICKKVNVMNDWFSKNDARYKSNGLEQIFGYALTSCGGINEIDN